MCVGVGGGTPVLAGYGAMKGFLIRVVVTGLALWLAAVIVPGVELGGDDLTQRVVTLLLVALVFGVVNAVLRPIVTVVAFPLYILTLGLIALVVNALLFWLTAALAGRLGLAFDVEGFLAALLGSLVVSIVTAVLGARD